jgi:hypothetical protein
MKLPGIIKVPLYIAGMYIGANVLALALVPIILGAAALLAAVVILSAFNG